MGLLELERYNAIIIYINRFIKMRHFIAIRNNIFTYNTAHLFINNIYALCGFPKTIMSNYRL